MQVDGMIHFTKQCGNRVIYIVHFFFLQEIVNFTKRLFMEVMNEMCTEITKEALDKVYVYSVSCS